MMSINELYHLIEPIFPVLLVTLLAGSFYLYRGAKIKNDRYKLMLGRKNAFQWNKPYIENDPDNIKRSVKGYIFTGIIFFLMGLCILGGFLLGKL